MVSIDSEAYYAELVISTAVLEPILKHKSKITAGAYLGITWLGVPNPRGPEARGRPGLSRVQGQRPGRS